MGRYSIRQTGVLHGRSGVVVTGQQAASLALTSTGLVRGFALAVAVQISLIQGVIVSMMSGDTNSNLSRLHLPTQRGLARK